MACEKSSISRSRRVEPREEWECARRKTEGLQCPDGNRVLVTCVRKALARNLAALLADEPARIQSDPVVPAAGGLLFLFAHQGAAPAEALNDHGAQAEENGQEAGIKPSEIHRSTSKRFFGLDAQYVHRTPQPSVLGNIYARQSPPSAGRSAR